MSLNSEGLQQVREWAKTRIARLERARATTDMVRQMGFPFEGFGDLQAKLLAGPELQVRQSTLNLERLMAKEPEMSGTEKMLLVAKRRTDLLRALLAKLKAK